MVRRHPTDPLDREPDEPLTFSDVTVLVLLAASAATLAAVLLLGTESAAARVAAALGLL